ncbi:MAG: hypothetical protein K0Q43_5680 [Ramlibacter sp.]|nr:hypothetical protein [Ramlibacter sp.]
MQLVSDCRQLAAAQRRSSWNSFGADAVALRYANFVKVDEARVRGIHPDLADLLRHLDALGQLAVRAVAHGYDHERLVLVRIVARSARPFARVHKHAHPVGLQAVGDPHFLAGDHVVVAILHGAALDAGDVAARARLAHADAGHHLARDRRRQELLAQLVAAEAREGRRRHVGLNADGHGNAAAMGVAQRLRHRHGIGVVQTRAAVFLRLGQAEQAQFTQALEHLVRRKYLRLFPFVDVGVDFFVDEALEGFLDFQVFVGVVHARLRFAVMPDLIRHPSWRASMDCRSSPQ